MDMRAGTETALARVVSVFGAAQPHCAYLFANRRANRMKVLVHDGVGIWLAARRLQQGIRLAGLSARYSGGIGDRAIAGFGAGFALATSRARWRHFHSITPATARRAVQLSDGSVVDFDLHE
jgi:hypothetical protein